MIIAEIYPIGYGKGVFFHSVNGIVETTPDANSYEGEWPFLASLEEAQAECDKMLPIYKSMDANPQMYQ